MEAKDTVMGNKKLQLLGQQYEDDLPTYDLNHYLLLAQAEISFKAGMETGNQQAYDIGVEDGKVEGVAEGMKEVVEWIRQEELAIPEWKLKEWGL